ncbi:MAG: serine/threonine-protein kinase [Acidobacteria bacterium]|nr:serine/threonine-protein kinase [Acidobacteriota bacterium]
MPIQPGSSLAHYEVLAPLGKGGMGEVFRAKDSKLGREVAIKVLPEEFTKDAERLARFEREARVLASLDHPHVAAIHGFEDVGGVRFLVMQLAPGEDLSDRLSRGPIPVAEAIGIARQIAEALESAHDQGIVHRDLKPANVKIDQDSNVKVLDFGLAKALEAEEADRDFSNSPTMVRAATHAGIILGTAAYMSPEQARGRKVDKRADIWAFGVVLWEMLTGQRLFSGETVSDTLAAVLTRRPDLTALPPDTPTAISWILERCLEPDPRKRLRDIGEARLAIERSHDEPARESANDERARGNRRIRHYAPWAIVALLLATLAFVVTRELRSTAPAALKPIAVSLAVFDDESLAPDGGSSVVISPDGRILVYVATGRDGNQLFMQQIDKLGVVPIPGTEGAASPFFSPDSRWLAFFSKNQLMKIATSGGAPLPICAAPQPRGGTWGDSGLIVFSGNLSTGLSVVSEDGGTPEPLTTLDESQNERSHRWPRFLPGGKAALYMGQKLGRNYDESLIKVVSLDTRESKLLHEGGAYPRYARSGHLLFSRSGALFAARFDLRALAMKGPAKPVIQQLFSRTGNEATDDGTAHYDVSSDGTLVYRQGGTSSSLSKIAIIDRAGKRIATSRPNQYLSPALSPDGKRVAVEVESDTGSNLWIWDVSRDTLSRFTFQPVRDNAPIWSPDGKLIAYHSNQQDDHRSRDGHLFIKPSDGAGVEVSLGGPAFSGGVSSWSADGRTLIFHELAGRGLVDGGDSNVDIKAISVGGDDAGKRRSIIDSPAAEVFGAISPDGRWIAHQSNESGVFQVYVRPFPGPGGKWQISLDGGSEPRWTRGGSELIWRNEDKGFATATIADNGTSLVVGEPRSFRFQGRFLAIPPRRMWDVSRDGETFVMLETEENSATEAKSIVLMTNWFEELDRLLPAK